MDTEDPTVAEAMPELRLALLEQTEKGENEMMETKAPACKEKKRHTWGKEIKIYIGIKSALYHQPCVVCGIKRSIKYGRRGNHVEGYIVTDIEAFPT